MKTVFIVTWIVSKIICNHFGAVEKCKQSDHEVIDIIQCKVFTSSETARIFQYQKMMDVKNVTYYEAVEK